MEPLSYHRPGLRAALLERAHEVVAQDGVEGLSLRALARDLDVSHAAPTRHFPDRQALLDSLALDGYRRLDSIIGRAVTEGGGAFDIRFRSVATAYVAFAVANPALLDLMYTTKHDPSASAELLASGHAALGPVASMIRRGQEEGVVREGDAADIARVVFACVHGVAALAVGGMLEGLSVERATDETVAILLRGLSAAPLASAGESA